LGIRYCVNGVSRLWTPSSLSLSEITRPTRDRTDKLATPHAVVNMGIGEHIWMINPNDITRLLFVRLSTRSPFGTRHHRANTRAKGSWVHELIYTLVVTGTKISVLFFYLRVFPDKGFRTACQVLIVVTGLYCLELMLSIIFSCTPVSYQWTRWDGLHKGKASCPLQGNLCRLDND
jgi:hypothetical protein